MTGRHYFWLSVIALIVIFVALPVVLTLGEIAHDGQILDTLNLCIEAGNPVDICRDLG